MFKMIDPPKSLPPLALVPCIASLDFSYLDGRVRTHPGFSSGYQGGYTLYFDLESADPGDIVYGAPVTSLGVIESICQSTLGTDYRETPDLFFWSVGTCASFLAALSYYHWKEAQAGLVVLTALSRVILSEVLAC